MSSAGNSGGGGGAPPHQYFCYQCDRNVTIPPPPSPTAELVCPNCHGGFLEESHTATAANPTDINPESFLAGSFPTSAASGGGFPIIFSSSAANRGGDGGRGLEDLSALLGTGSSVNEFNPFAFLNSYVNNLQARGTNIQIVFESPGGGGSGSGGGFDFGLPTNLGDYFVGPGLEQLIQQLAENDPNRYGTPPASKSAVEKLPDIKITDEILGSDSYQCAVCTDSFELKGEAKQMPCKHIYHKDCLLPWLELHNSCPICRYELPTDDPDYENQRTGQTNNNNNTSRNSIIGRSLGLGAAFGGQELRDDGNNNDRSETPRTVERRYRVSLPWPFRGFGSPAETSGSASNNDGGNNSGNNNSNNGSSNTGSGGGQAREEDLD
ncbi:hypothetical protein CASFOL_038433 [Castilleja foliolosa]|uniref:RING-type E3 ubiquitin transferase n=1 Tax=Castilleja foliolosa TaxID=1961234 RepID=A0ABD3BLG4_9LAMI